MTLRLWVPFSQGRFGLLVVKPMCLFRGILRDVEG